MSAGGRIVLRAFRDPTNGDHSDEHERTMAFAEIALGQIKALRQPAIAAQFRGLVLLRDRLPPVAQRDHQRDPVAHRHADRSTTSTRSTTLYLFTDPARRHASTRSASRVMDEIEQVMAMVDAAVGSASNYSKASPACRAIFRRADRDGVRSHRRKPRRQTARRWSWSITSWKSASPPRSRRSTSFSKISRSCATKA